MLLFLGNWVVIMYTDSVLVKDSSKTLTGVFKIGFYFYD